MIISAYLERLEENEFCELCSHSTAVFHSFVLVSLFACRSVKDP